VPITSIDSARVNRAISKSAISKSAVLKGSVLKDVRPYLRSPNIRRQKYLMTIDPITKFENCWTNTFASLVVASSVVSIVSIALLLLPPASTARSKSGSASGSTSSSSSSSSSSSGAGSGKHPASRAAWCHAVVAQPLPTQVIGGTVGGKPFKPDTVQWNSYSITLKQSHKRYCKVVVNMMKSQKPLCDLSFTSDTNQKPHIYVYTRNSMSEPVLEQHYTNKDGYGLKLVLLSPQMVDFVPGSLSLRLPDGSFVAGKFTAGKAPRLIWDDQTFTP
jgi:hypothetical protein